MAAINGSSGNDSLTGTSGNDTISGFGGKVVLLDFMFVECPPCRAMLPNLSKLHERYKERGFAVVSAAPAWGSKGLRALIEQKGLTHAFLELPEDEERRWEVSAFPTLFLIDRHGEIRATVVGAEPEESLIEAMIAEAEAPK